VTFCVVKPKERSITFPEHEKILQTTLESYVNRVSVHVQLQISLKVTILSYAVCLGIDREGRSQKFVSERYKILIIIVYTLYQELKLIS